MLTVVDAAGTTPDGFLIDEIVREGARRMLAAALETEVNGYLADLADQRDERGRRLVVRNGFHAERTIATSAGPIQVKAPRVNEALREVFPETREQRCWVHKTANVLDALPKSAQPAAKNAIADIYNAEDKDQARAAVKAFAKRYGAKFPKSVAKVVDDEDVMLAFYDYPAEHWIHLRTTNPIESTFSTVRLRTKVTRGAGSRSTALAMTFKLIESAQERWRAVNAPHLVALVRAGARFKRGVLVEREDASAA